MTTHEIRNVATAFSVLGALCIVLWAITKHPALGGAAVVFALPAVVVLWLVWWREHGPRV
jgi:hypothetical protein